MALPNGPVVLPFKSEKLSFSLTYKSNTAPTAQVELACLCFDRDAQVLDFVQYNRRAALNSALKHSGCSYVPPKDAISGADEAIHMYPFDFSAKCEVMLLLASAPRNSFLPNDLSTSRKLQFKVHARELGAQQVQLLDVDLSPLVDDPQKQAATAAGPLSNGNQTMVIAGVYTTPQGWTLSIDCSTFPEDHWGLLLPQLRSLLQRWPVLSAATAAAAAKLNPKLQQQVFISSRKGTDDALAELAARLPAPKAAVKAVEVLAPDEQGANTAEGVAAAETSRSGLAEAEASEDKTPGAAAAEVATPSGPDGSQASAAAAATAPVLERLVLELGWEVFKPRPPADDEGEEEEEPVVDFALSIHNLQGEEMTVLNIDNPQFDGVNVEDEPAEEEAEEVAAADAEQAIAGDEQPAAEGAEEDAGDGESKAAAGEEDDDNFVKEDNGEDEDDPSSKQESAEAKASKAAAAAEAAAAAAQAAAANQRPLVEKFPLKRRVQLSLPELPPESRALVLTMSCFGGSGFKNVKTLQARLLVAPPQPKKQEGAEEQGGDEDDEASRPKKKQGPKQPDKVLLHYRFDSVQGADAHLTQVLVWKLYKEYPDSAFAVWVQQKVPDVVSLLGGHAAVEAAAVAAAAATAPAADGSAAAVVGPNTQHGKEVLQQVLAARKQLVADLAARRAKAAEEGLDEEDEEGQELDLRLARGVWRVRVLGLTSGGESPEDLAPTLNNLLAYDGDLDPSGQRTSPACKVAYPNRDTYFGPYAAGAKAGTGMYVAANGACFVGQYAGGKRSGFGLMILPDGGMYKGGFKEDKFEGQGTYMYPDNSLYTGSWRAGQKHGQGTYWDKSGGCLRGEWVSGNLKGQAQYDQPHYHFEGRFSKGLPAGPCSFSLSSEFRTAGLPQAAATYIIAPHGPTLQGEGKYALPPDDADEGAKAGEEGEGEEGGGLPAWPKYEGLTYQSALSRPCSVPDVPFPPATALMATI